MQCHVHGHVQWKFPSTTIPLAAEESSLHSLLSIKKVCLLWQLTARKASLNLHAGQSFFVPASIIPQRKAERKFTLLNILLRTETVVVLVFFRSFLFLGFFVLLLLFGLFYYKRFLA